MNPAQLRQRKQALQADVQAKTAEHHAGRLSNRDFHRFLDSAEAEQRSLAASKDVIDTSRRFAAGAERAAGGDVETDSKAMGEVRPETPLNMTRSQVKSLYEAMRARTPFSVTLGEQNAITDNLGTKDLDSSTAQVSNVDGGNFAGNLPPVQTPFAVGLGYETTRIADLLPGASMPGPSATWISHTGNENEAGAVGEGKTKPTIGPKMKENQVRPQKIAALVDLSLEAWQDTGDYGEAQFASFLPQEAARSIVNQESNYLLNAGTDGGPEAVFDGLLAQQDTLTRKVGSDDPFDALAKSFNDLRVGPAFAYPDTIIMHPTTYNEMRLKRDDNGRFLLDLFAGPLGITSHGQPDRAMPSTDRNAYSVIPQGNPAISGSIWGVPVALTTQVPKGTGIVMSVKAGGGMFWTRLGMRLEFNMWASEYWGSNAYGFRVEERVSLSVPRPAALNILTGLPGSDSGDESA